MKIKINTNLLLFQLVIIFIFFDGIRSNLIFGNVLTLLREMLFPILFYRLFFKRKLKTFSFIDRPVKVFVIYHLVLSIYSMLLPGRIEPSFIIKPLNLIIAVYCFYYFSELTNKSYAYLFEFIIKIGCVFVIINTIFYFIPLPIFVENKLWWGRISIGYPTMDVVSLAYSLSILLFYPYLTLNTYVRVIFLLIYILGILFNASGTGTVLLSLIILTSISFKKTIKFNAKPIMYTFVFLLISSTSVVSYLYENYPEEFNNGIVLLENKIDILKGEEVETNTMETRKMQYENMVSKMSVMEKILGRSLINVSNDATINRKGIYMIEDQYNLTKVCYGYIGFLLYAYMIIHFFFKACQLKGERSIRLMLVLSAVIFAANSKTLITLVLFPNYAFISLAMAYTAKYKFILRNNNLAKYV